VCTVVELRWKKDWGRIRVCVLRVSVLNCGYPVGFGIESMEVILQVTWIFFSDSIIRDGSHFRCVFMLVLSCLPSRMLLEADNCIDGSHDFGWLMLYGVGKPVWFISM